jgi:hypothetical protein
LRSKWYQFRYHYWHSFRYQCGTNLGTGILFFGTAIADLGAVTARLF